MLYLYILENLREVENKDSYTELVVCISKKIFIVIFTEKFINIQDEIIKRKL